MQVSEYFSKKRLIVFFVAISLLALYIVFNYAKLSVKPLPEQASRKYIPERGSILDRNGKALAIEASFYNVGVSPTAIKEPERTAQLISAPLGIQPDYIVKQIKGSKADFIYLKKKIEQPEYDDISKIISENSIFGFVFDRIPGRVYPENNLASQVIGFMGNEGKGLSGIELTQNDILSPQNADLSQPQHGKDVYLTLDANLQYKLEKIAKAAIDSTQAESLMLVAAQAKTGEILSYISLPSANLNTYPTATDTEKKNHPASTAYEPGSVFKIFSVASFISSNAISEDDTFVCDGMYQIKSGNETVRIACLGHHGRVTAREALQYSCNDALAQMSEKIPADMFLQYIHSLGFGEKTNIELTGETKGSVKTTSSKYWSGRSKATISIGQEISVSALQMVQATTAITNKGFPVKLTLISQIVNQEGIAEYQHKPEFLPQAISENAAKYLLSCMETTAKSGTGTRALLGDVSIGVKTGTAQMADIKNGGYSDTDFLSNCVAIFPIEDPQIILYIVITKAKGETYAGRIVAPVIAEAANSIIDHLGLARAKAASLAHTGKISIQSTSAPEVTTTIPDFTGTPKRLIAPLLERQDLNIRIEGDGWVVRQNPPPGTPVTENMLIELYLE